MGKEEMGCRSSYGFSLTPLVGLFLLLMELPCSTQGEGQEGWSGSSSARTSPACLQLGIFRMSKLRDKKEKKKKMGVEWGAGEELKKGVWK